MDEKYTNQAVWNNALWCNMICTTHGIPGEFLDGFWVCRHQAPPYYPNLVTLEKHLTAKQLESLRELLEEGLPAAAGIKDSYANLDLSEKDFQILFDGKWICLPTKTRMTTKDINNMHWETVTEEETLKQWERAWRGLPLDELEIPQPMIFLPDLLIDDRLCMIAGYAGGQIVAGAIGLLSGQIVGVSNVFVPADDENSYRAGCIEKIRTIFPDKPIVGYESAGDLKAMLEIGFEEIGSMRVWVRNDAD